MEPTPTSAFPETHARQPINSLSHTHTLVLLHGRGSNGPEVADEFLATRLPPTNQTIAELLPTWRFVFPSSQGRWSSTFQEEEDAWFDIASLTDVEAKKETQINGLRESVRHVVDLLHEEIEGVNGDASKVFLGGISMGMATALWSLFYYYHCADTKAREGQKIALGGFVGFSGWLPFWTNIDTLANQEDAYSAISHFIVTTLEHDPSGPADGISAVDQLHHLPMFLGHGRDDAYVDISLGRKVGEVFGGKLGMAVTRGEYEGADSEGHWLKEPEEFQDLMAFLKSVLAHELG